MDFERLQQNLCDNIYEAQLKLGYDRRPMSLNYTLRTLCHLIGNECGSDKMEGILGEFAEVSAQKLGNITFRPIKGGFCITIPTEGTDYVNSHPNGHEFMTELVSAVRIHADTEAVLALFRKASPDAVIRELDNDEFRFLVYFPDSKPDDYYYCISEDEEMDGSVHTSYHRFIREDYEDFDF